MNATETKTKTMKFQKQYVGCVDEASAVGRAFAEIHQGGYLSEGFTVRRVTVAPVDLSCAVGSEQPQVEKGHRVVVVVSFSTNG